MKKIVSMIICVIMIASLAAVIAVPASAGDPSVKPYDEAKNGDVLYTVDFSGTDGIYAPFNFRNGAAKMAATTVDVQDEGKTIVATAPASAGAAWFYGGKIGAYTLGADKQYTITMKAAFPTGNAGVYFNFPNIEKTEGYDATLDMTYTNLYGLYGTINPAKACITMSTAAGGKIPGEKVSEAGVYTMLPEGVAADGEGFVDVTIKIDGYFYSVWFNGILYDQVRLNKNMIDAAPNLGFTVYLYNNNAKFTVKNVVVTKGTDYAASNSIYKYSALDYNAFKLGDKITDILFNATEGAYKLQKVQEANAANVAVDVAADGKTITLTNNDGTAAAHWYGASFDGLKITDDTKYTFTYKVKDTGSTYSGCVAYNAVEFALNTGNRYNWYGKFTLAANPAMKFAYNGTNFTGYNYTDEPMKCFNTIVPAKDADGYVEVAAELEGWVWSFYMADANHDGKLTLVQTLNVKELGTAEGKTIGATDALAFEVYTYNKSVSYSVKDAALYKGAVISNDYSNIPEDTTTAQGGEDTTVPGGDETTVPGGDETTVPGGDETTVPGGDETTVPGGDETTAQGGDETTPAPSDDTTKKADDTTGAADEAGCAGCGSFGIAGLIVVLALGAAIVIKKK